MKKAKVAAKKAPPKKKAVAPKKAPPKKKAAAPKKAPPKKKATTPKPSAENSKDKKPEELESLTLGALKKSVGRLQLAMKVVDAGTNDLAFLPGHIAAANGAISIFSVLDSDLELKKPLAVEAAAFASYVAGLKGKDDDPVGLSESGSGLIVSSPGKSATADFCRVSAPPQISLEGFQFGTWKEIKGPALWAENLKRASLTASKVATSAGCGIHVTKAGLACSSDLVRVSAIKLSTGFGKAVTLPVDVVEYLSKFVGSSLSFQLLDPGTGGQFVDSGRVAFNIDDGSLIIVAGLLPSEFPDIQEIVRRFQSTDANTVSQEVPFTPEIREALARHARVQSSVFAAGQRIVRLSCRGTRMVIQSTTPKARFDDSCVIEDGIDGHVTLAVNPELVANVNCKTMTIVKRSHEGQEQTAAMFTDRKTFTILVAGINEKD